MEWETEETFSGMGASVVVSVTVEGKRLGVNLLVSEFFWCIPYVLWSEEGKPGVVIVCRYARGTCTALSM